MTGDFEPFRGIRGIGDLLLVHECTDGTAARVVIPGDAYFPELCVWVTLPAGAGIFPPGGRVLLAGMHSDGPGWRLMLTEHGYLRFAARGGEGPSCESGVPVHTALDPSRDYRLGLSIANLAWAVRDTQYAAEAGPYTRVRLLAGPADGDLSQIGELAGALPPDLAPVPEVLEVGDAALEVLAWNAEEADRIVGVAGRPATDLLPLIPGGSSFEPRWVGERTVEFFTHPDFSRTSSYWVFLRVEEVAPMPDRLVVRTTWHGGANMTPTFFASRDRSDWWRVAPVRVHMGPGRTDWAAEFDARALAGCYLASAPVFGDEERRALLTWAAAQPHVTVREIGRSVEGRPLHVIRVGAREDGGAPHGVVVLCGQHSPLEIMTARVIEPMIRALIARPELLDACSFWFVPTVNVDCAHYGGNGANAARRNLNRHWFTELQPETACIIEMLEGLLAAGQRIDLGIDLHAGGIFRNHVLMPMGPTEEVPLSAQALAEQEIWRDLLERHAGLRRADGRPLAQQKLRASDWLHQVAGATGLCLEMSTCSFFDPRTGRTREFGLDAFDVLAHGIVAACAERFLGPAAGAQR